MKILHIIFSLNTGGAETMLVDIMNEQSKTHTVELLIINNIVNKSLVDTIDKKVTIHYSNRIPGDKNPLPIFRVNYKVVKINPAVIHFHNHNGVNLLKLKGKALICLTIHDVNIPVVNFHKYNKLFSISNAVQEDVLARSGIMSIKVYNGIRFDKIDFEPIYGEFGKFRIIQVSRLDHEKKGQDILINAVSILSKQRGLDNIELDFIGEGNSLEYLKNLSKELNLEKQINFLGSKTRGIIYKELKNYQLLVQPSLFEGFGLTVVEAIAAKIPVLVSDIDGPMEIIAAGKYGSYFKKGDASSCADKIYDIIHNYQIDCKMNEAYNYAKTNFNIQETAINYIKNYES
jgi:glycosyltransferase involved in cell wall biosynthesis